MKTTRIAGSVAIIAFLLGAAVSCTQSYDTVIIGGGASGTAAGIQSARMGASTLIVEQGPWLGGMLTSAGVCCIDGNYRMRAGIFGEFTDAIAAHYGGYDKLRTGWVSNINFEPHVAESALESLAASESGLTVLKNTSYSGLKHLRRGWSLTIATPDGQSRRIRARVLIDGTELGDVAAELGIPYRKGFDAKSDTHESIALDKALDVVQDITMVAILKDYGADADMTISRPEGYDKDRYANSCDNPLADPSTTDQALWAPEKMLSYGAISGGKYMINWPIHGNDYYVNLIDMSPEEREAAIREATDITLGFVYFIQTELGMKNIGLADDEFPGGSGIALIPYHRESRRIHARVLFTLDDAAKPYEAASPLYRTGIAVGDYPVDHHHHAYLQRHSLPDLHFYPIPSFNVPAGVLLPECMEDIIVAEKSIGVTNLINGGTRLQPVCLQLGQAAGAMAALAARHGIHPSEVGIRELQQSILDAGGYIMPYLDLPKGHEHFQALQRVGATGIMHGEGRSVGWSNETWFHAGEPMTEDAIHLEGLPWKREDLPVITPGMTREEYAVLLDSTLDLFGQRIDFNGNLK